MKDLGFIRCLQEQAAYKRCSGAKTLLVGVYVDDLIITGTSVHEIMQFKRQMRREFEMSDPGFLTYCLGIEVDQKAGSIT